MYKKNKINKWTHKTDKYVYKSDYQIKLPNIYKIKIKYTNFQKKQ